MSARVMVQSCDMSVKCERTPTHLEEGGWLYCEEHAVVRRSIGKRARKLRPWEIRWINAQRRLPSYRPGPEPKET